MGVSAATVRRLALSLPETAEAPHHDMTSFRVAGKIFATMPPEGGRVHVFVGDDEVSAYTAEYPAVVEELLWGTKRRGCRVLLAKATAPLVRELLTESWRGKAPKKVLADFDG
jgi:hypothetical protein